MTRTYKRSGHDGSMITITDDTQPDTVLMFAEGHEEWQQAHDAAARGEIIIEPADVVQLPPRLPRPDFGDDLPPNYGNALVAEVRALRQLLAQPTITDTQQQDAMRRMARMLMFLVDREVSRG